MKCLVTGGAGFIGSHLVDLLIKRGNDVSVVDDLSTGKITNINKLSKFYKVKIESRKLEQVFAEIKPEIVFHFAAQSQVKRSVANPLLDARTNILGTINLLRLSVKYKVNKFIFASSGGVIYGNTHKPASEDYPPNPISPYGISKKVGEEYIKFYSRAGLKYSIFRYSNVYGPRQDPYGEAGVVAIWSNLMLRNKPCILYGFGKFVRDYIYVEDAVNATIIAMNKADDETINIGSGIPTSVNELFEKMRLIIGYSIPPIYKPGREGEIEINYLDCTKALKVLDWKPQTNLETGVSKTINWVKSGVVR